MITEEVAPRILRFPRRFARWLRDCFLCDGKHGCDLVKIYPGGQADPDNDLLFAEQQGWIRRFKCSPTIEQRFNANCFSDAANHPATYWWTPVSGDRSNVDLFLAKQGSSLC